jgi:hypothetical protein
MTGAERLRRYRERVRKEQEATPDPSASPELIEARQEIARLRRRNRMLVEGMKIGADTERVFRRLRIAIKEFYDGTASNRFTATAKIAKALHPDYKPTDAERAEAFKAFSQLKQSLDKATTPEPAAPRKRQRRPFRSAF